MTEETESITSGKKNRTLPSEVPLCGAVRFDSALKAEEAR